MELGGSGATAFCLALGIMVFTGYYLKSVVRKPRIICKPKSFISKLIKHSFPFVHKLYWPTFWCFGGRAQTVTASLLKSHPSVDYSREFIHMPDGGVVALDWANAASIPTSHFTVLILPGLVQAQLTIITSVILFCTSFKNWIAPLLFLITEV